MGMRFSGKRYLAIPLLLLLCEGATAWGRVGHETVVRIAIEEMAPDTLEAAKALLDTDEAGLVAAATWADKVRDDEEDDRWAHSFSWHFTNIDIDDPDIASACHGHPAVPEGKWASEAPAGSCAIDKIAQFHAELGDPEVPARERRLALKFLLHLVGDLHQPLHSADDDDRGGNDKRARLPGHDPAPLHHYWDTVLVPAIEGGPRALAKALGAGDETPTADDALAPDPRAWAEQTYALARGAVYASLPEADAEGVHVLDEGYRRQAESIVAVQLQRAGRRLAELLDDALAGS